ncbi:MAG: phosphoribosylformylglycinamidine synthase I [Thaumarchaeota archaeon]|nr:phosphoribosylformylglycinamidine synthase I [Nitrososphaerota archaeon]|tara:strand:+ start:579 stop:1262 length:684 start_codon:yes stop_codon:yes gene_type:complete
MKIGIVVFPGSNCDMDVHYVFRKVLHTNTEFIWHKHNNLQDYDAIILPGGFTYGDRLRAGVIAAFSPVMKEVKRLATEGKPILGICNGFQILVESGLLPGAFMKNDSLKFVCKWINITVETNRTPFTYGLKLNHQISIPVANQEGRFFADPKTLKTLELNNQIIFKYHNDNPNGSVNAIAGISNMKGNVVGIMPHPERASENILNPFGNNDAILIFKSLLDYMDEQK